MRNQKFEPCELFKLIPKEKIEHIFTVSETAGAELDHTFLGFEKVYKAVTLFVPKTRIIIDFGCGYAFQSWYFKDYKKYIGVDSFSTENDVLKTDNAEFFFMRIQDFIKSYVRKDRSGFCDIKLENMDWQSVENVFAICSYVPDADAQRLVRETFPHCLIYYPGGSRNEPLAQEK